MLGACVPKRIITPTLTALSTYSGYIAYIIECACVLVCLVLVRCATHGTITSFAAVVCVVSLVAVCGHASSPGEGINTNGMIIMRVFVL